MIKFLKYVLAYFYDKEPEELKVVKIKVERSSSTDYISQINVGHPLCIIAVKNKRRHSNTGNSGMMVMGSMSDMCFDPQMLLTVTNSAVADSLGKGLAELFKKHGVNLSVEGNLGDKKENVTTQTMVKYLEQA
jgi:hypothetical protein